MDNNRDRREYFDCEEVSDAVDRVNYSCEEERGYTRNRKCDRFAEALEEAFNEGYKKGYCVGYQEGYEKGYCEGYKEGCKDGQEKAKEDILSFIKKRRCCCKCFKRRHC